MGDLQFRAGDLDTAHVVIGSPAVPIPKLQRHIWNICNIWQHTVQAYSLVPERVNGRVFLFRLGLHTRKTKHNQVPEKP